MNGEKFGRYAKDIGPTAAFVKRTVEATANSGKKLKERRDAKEEGKIDSFTVILGSLVSRQQLRQTNLAIMFLAQSKQIHQDFQ